LRFFSLTTGVPLTPPIAAGAFFFADPANIVSDPQVFFDEKSNRWFFTMVETNLSTVEQLDIAVSRTGNPIGSYNIYHVTPFSSDIPDCGGLNCLPDFPKAGFDANGFFISVNLFGPAAGTACNGSGLAPIGAVGAATFVIPKAPLVAGAALPFIARVT